MLKDPMIDWALMGVFVLAGIGLLLSKVDDRQIEILNRWFPPGTLYRFRAVRYGAAVALFILAGVVYLSAQAAAQDIPADGLHCGLQEPPEAAAKGVRPPHQQPMRMFPVNPGAQYTGCQWIWISFGFPPAWNYSAVTYYEAGAPKLHRVTYPPLPVQVTVQECVFDADGRVRKVLDGSWQQDCPSSRQLQELLRIAPKENDSWTFF